MSDRRFFRRNLISITVVIAALTALAGGLVLIGMAVNARMHFERLREVQVAADGLLRAAALQARERALLAAMLDNGPVRESLDDVLHRRMQSEASWQRSLESIDRIRAGAPNPLLLARFARRAQAAHERLRAVRARADRSAQTGVPELSREEWWNAITEDNQASGELRDQLLGAAPLPQENGLNASLARAAWTLGEQAGSIDAIIAYHVERRVPIDDSSIERVASLRLAMRHTLDELSQWRGFPDLPAHLRTAIDAVERGLGDQFGKSIGAMLREASTGEYPLDASTWYQATSVQIERIVAFSGAAATHEMSILRASAERRSLALGGFVLLTLAGAWFASRSLRKVKRDADTLFLQKELAEVTLQSIGDAVATTNARGTIQYLNPAAEELTGWSMLEARGRPANEVLRIEKAASGSVVDPVWACLRQGQVVGMAGGHVLVRRDGSRAAIEDSAAPIRSRDAKVVGCVVVFYDAGSPRNSDHLLSYHATRDPLTGLINRRDFDRRLEEMVRHPTAGSGRHVLAYVDLDQFKVVNDTCGHMAGDRLLRQVAFLARKTIRTGDVLARLGGDEFAVLLYDCPLEKGVSILGELCRSVGEFRFVWENKAFTISTSIGVVPIGSSSATAAELLSAADAACYAAKEKGRNRLQVYQPDDMELFERKGEMHWLPRITAALQEDRFVLHCQRLMPLRPGLPERIEILLRMRSPNGELVAPMAFIPAAERYNLMSKIDRWVIRNACVRLARFLAENAETIVNINLSALSLGESDIVQFIAASAQRSGIAPRQLCFEITETAAVASMDVASGAMQEISDRGFSFSLDDFGTGLSSFSYLKTLPVRQIKIGDNYVRNMLSDPLSHAIVRSVVDIGNVLGVRVCAECVEDAATLAALAGMGVGHAQGFAVQRPIPLDEFLRMAQKETLVT